MRTLNLAVHALAINNKLFIVALNNCNFESSDRYSIFMYTKPEDFTFCPALWGHYVQYMCTLSVKRLVSSVPFEVANMYNYSGREGFFNRSNSTSATVDPCLLCWSIIPFYLVIVGVHIVVLCLAVSARAVHSSIRFVLANILVASIIAGLGTCMIIFLRGIWSIVPHLSPSDGLCRFFLVATAVGGSGRTMFMAVFAFVVYVIIRYSTRTVKLKHLVIFAFMVWLVCIGFHSALFTPDVLQVLRADYTGCLILSAQYGWAYITPYLVLFALLPFAVTVTMPTAAYCCIRANTLRESSVTVKPMVKFALFLLLGNLLGFVGHATPVVAAPIGHGSDRNEKYILRSFSILIILSLIPTPILILVYFKPIRYQISYCARLIGRKLHCIPRKRIASWRDPPTEMMSVEVKKDEQ